MKVRLVSLELREEQRRHLGRDPQVRYELTLGKEYIVYAIGCTPDSHTDVTSYDILDDRNLLMPAPACLFEITDPYVSKYWRATQNGLIFRLQPQEFIDNPGLTEEIVDGDPGAWAVFRDIYARFEKEARARSLG